MYRYQAGTDTDNQVVSCCSQSKFVYHRVTGLAGVPYHNPRKRPNCSKLAAADRALQSAGGDISTPSVPLNAVKCSLPGRRGHGSVGARCMPVSNSNVWSPPSPQEQM